MCYILFMLQITKKVSIPEEEITFTASRSSGPGGQHVNTTSTRVTLTFDVINSPSLTPEQKKLITERLPTRVSKRGLLRVVSQKTRSQTANKEVALEKFVDLLQYALKRERRRKATKVSPAAKQKRLDDKKRRGRLKRERTWQQ
jgi:ribosome-associated protein